MDNAAFRSLVSKSPKDGSSAGTFKKPMALGSRSRSSIPMTPRNIPGYSQKSEFARQVAEHTSSNGEPPLKKFRSSAAPKGSKLGAGYVDRAQLRQGQDEELDSTDDKERRLKNLEEQLKLQQITQEQFEKLRDQIGVGGDVSSTHLVKGLDWKLLDRVRRGEDVVKSESEKINGSNTEEASEIDVDEELERALEKEVVASAREQKEEPTEEQQNQQQVLTRDEILRRFREKRNAPLTPAAPALNEKFKKVAAPEKQGKKKFIESVNGRRREVLVITNKDGTTKRKTRWIDPEDTTKLEQQPLGMQIPAEFVAKQKAILEAEAAENNSEDIFADAGDDYDPLADINSESEESETERTQQSTEHDTTNSTKRNYFTTSSDVTGEGSSTDRTTTDPTILAALKRAAQIRQREEGQGDTRGSEAQKEELRGEAKSSAFLAKLKERERQDDADLDYGFGESRFGDDDDDEGGGPLFDDEGESDKKKGSRKRGPKKRKGNKDNVQDVMSVLEGRKTER